MCFRPLLGLSLHTLYDPPPKTIASFLVKLVLSDVAVLIEMSVDVPGLHTH
jgi:hypothetical protein